MASLLTGEPAGWTSTSWNRDLRARAPSGRGRPGRTAPRRDAAPAPLKALGQHFLSDRSLIERIVAGADVGPDDVVIEVGPGPGALTERLAEAARQVIGVEIDRRMVEALRERFAGSSSVTIVEADAVEASPEALLEAAGLRPDTPYVLMGNLPYNVGTAIVRNFLEAEHPPTRMVVMLQKEVADNILAGPGAMGLLAVSVQVYAVPRRLFNVPPGAFRPPPKVSSTVLRLDTRPAPLVPKRERGAFFRVLRAGFSAPRKQLRNALSQGLEIPATAAARAIAAAGLDPSARPQRLAPDDWLRLARALEGT